MLSDFASLKACLSLEEQHYLQLRLDKLLLDWEQLSAGLAERTCQLKFEWSQTVSLHSVHVQHTTLHEKNYKKKKREIYNPRKHEKFTNFFTIKFCNEITRYM